MDDQKRLTEQESVFLIASMINRAKNRFSENGFLYLVWGWVILVCCLVEFVTKIFMHSNKGYYVWFITWIVFVFQIIYIRRRKRSETVRTYTDELNGYIWIAFVIALFSSLFVIIQFDLPMIINPFILILYGIPIFISGGLLQFRPLLFGGIFCWFLAAVSPFISPDYRVLLIAAAILVAWIIPGYLLKSRYRKQLN